MKTKIAVNAGRGGPLAASALKTALAVTLVVALSVPTQWSYADEGTEASDLQETTEDPSDHVASMPEGADDTVAVESAVPEDEESSSSKHHATPASESPKSQELDEAIQEEPRLAPLSFLKSDASTLALDLGRGQVSLAQISADAGIDPENFLPGVAGQKSITLTVSYRPDPNKSGRWFTVKLPDGFSVEASPSSLTSGTISRKGNLFTIELRDDVTVDVSFDIVVMQNSKILYDKANDAESVFPFEMNCYTAAGGDTPEYTSSLDFKIAKLAPAEYSFSVDNNAKSFSDIGTNSVPTIGFDFTVVKKAHTALDQNFIIALPRKLVSAEGDELVLSTVPHDTIVERQDDDFVYVRPAPNVVDGRYEYYDSYFNHAYVDAALTVRLEYQPMSGTGMFSNELYASSEMTAESSRADSIMTWAFDKTLSLDTATASRVPKINGNLTKRDVLTGEADVSIDITVDYYPYEPRLHAKQIEMTVDIPDEVVLKAGPQDSDGSVWTYRTNTGREIKSGDIAGLDSSHEWVATVEYRGSSFEASSGAKRPLFTVDIRTTYPDGTPVPDTTASYWVSVDSLSEPYPTVSKSIDVSIASLKDDLRIVPEDYDAVTLTSAQTLGRFAVQGGVSTMVYENAVITFGNPSFLSLVDTVSLGSSLRDSVLSFETNAGTTGSISVSDVGGEVTNFVPSGEYLTRLSLSFEKLNGMKLGDIVYLERKSMMPETLPSDPSFDLAGKQLVTSVDLSAQNATSKSQSFKTNFYHAIDSQIMSVGDQSGTEYCPDDSPSTGSSRIKIAEVGLASISNEHAIGYENMSIDFAGTDPRILALTTTVKASSQIDSKMNLEYTTNLNATPRTALFYSGESPLSPLLSEGEYIVSLKLVPKTGSRPYLPRLGASSVELYMESRTWSFADTGDSFPDDPTSYAVKASFSADNSSSYDREGKSISFYNKASAKVQRVNVSSSYDLSTVYQGDTFKASIRTTASVVYAGEYRLVSPVYYFKVNGDYSLRQDSIVVTLRGRAFETIVAESPTSDGGAIVKVEVPGYTFLQTPEEPDPPLALSFDFEMRAKPSASPVPGKTPIDRVWVDLNASAGVPDEGFSPVVLENTTTDGEGVLGLPVGKPLYAANTGSLQTVLELIEVGSSTLAESDGWLSSDVSGRDDSSFGQQLSLISHMTDATTNWVVYVPIPKEGLSAHYQARENDGLAVKDTDPSAFSMNLMGPVENVGDDAVVTYSTDASPAYDLQGAAVGSYVDASQVSDWSAVTMIRISIPRMEAREKRFPVLRYESERKAELGDEVAYTGIYYNFKVGDAPEWYGGSGLYGAKNSYTLFDFVVNGFAWWQEGVSAAAESAAPESARAPLANVEVSTVNAVTGATLATRSGDDGMYALPVPSHGDYVLTAAAPSSRYELVEKGDAADQDSSKFDPTTSQTVVSLSRIDVRHVNVGYSNTGINSDPTVLPTTGGVGGALFVVAGLGLVIASASAASLRSRRLRRRNG